MSQMMDEIGVNEKTVIIRRKYRLLLEALGMLSIQIAGIDRKTYCFGSDIEGTSTPGLKSDFDFLFTENGYNVIQDLSDWEDGKQNFLMIHTLLGQP
jgi:hypothetical protein